VKGRRGRGRERDRKRAPPYMDLDIELTNMEHSEHKKAVLKPVTLSLTPL